MTSLLRPLPATAAAAPGDDTLAAVLAEVGGREWQPGALITDVLAGGFRSTFRGGGVEFSDVREYVEGDDPRAVDWNVTARYGRPFVKRFVEERERTIVFVFDLAAGLAAGIGAWSARQALARAAVCLSVMAIANHDRVGFVAGDEARGVVRLQLPKKGAGHVLRIARDCVELPTGAGGPALDLLLGRVGAQLRRRVVVFVCSTFAGSEPLATLPLLARHHDVVAVRALPREWQHPPPTLLRARDPATGRVAAIDFAAPSVRAAWSDHLAAWRHGRDHEFAHAGVDCIDLELPAAPDVDAIVTPLLRFFHRRQVRGRRR